MNERSEASKGETVAAQGERQERAPKAPHERDESSGSQAGGEPAAGEIGALAHDDARTGQPDTDKGPVMDKTYERMRGK